MAVSAGKGAKLKSTSAKRVLPAARRSLHASSGRSSPPAAAMTGEAVIIAVRTSKSPREGPGAGITYTPRAGVVPYAMRVARATPMEAVEIERQGVSGRYLKDLAKQLGLATTRVLSIIDMPRATAAKKAASGEPVTGHSGQAALALTKLVAMANELATGSTDPRAKDLDAAKWLGSWIERPQPALGGRRPADLLDTPTGADVVARLLGSIASGAYQ